MSVSPKPTEQITWAEGTPPAIAGTNPPTDPGAGRKGTGYGYGETLPHEHFNWLFRGVIRWINWLVSKVDNHVHDGGTTPASAPKVDIQNHVAWSEQELGFALDVTLDTAGFHVISHVGGGPTSKSIISDVLEARSYINTPAINPGAGTTVSITGLDSPRVIPAWARVTGTDGSPSYISSHGFNTGVAVNKTGTGNYQLTLSAAPPANTIAVAFAHGGPGFVSATLSSNIITVQAFGTTGSAADVDFTVELRTP
jgi:hypothetical protein